MTRLTAPALTLALAAVACGNPPPTSGDVIQLSVCDPSRDAACRPVADGRSLVTVTACAPDGHRVSPLDLTLKLSSSAWSTPTDPIDPRTITISLVAERCASPAFVASTQPGPVRIDAQLLGFRATQYVVLAPAKLETLTIVPTPAALTAGQPNAITLVASATVSNLGSPSKGTRIAWRVTEVVPASAAAFVVPAEVDLDAAAPAVLRADSTVTSLAVEGTATPPAIDSAPTPSSLVATTRLQVVP